MIETKEIEIKGATYLVTQMTARRAIRMQAKLMKLLGPALSTIIVAASEDVNTSDKAIPEAIKYLVSELDDKTFEALVMELLVGVRKDNFELIPSVIDLEFAGDLNTLFLLLKFILEVNYGSFFDQDGILSMLIPSQKTAIAQKE